MRRKLVAAVFSLAVLTGCTQDELERKSSECTLEAKKQYGVQETQYDNDVLHGRIGSNPWRNKIGEATYLCMRAAGYLSVGGCENAGWVMTSCYRRKTVPEYLGISSK